MRHANDGPSEEGLSARAGVCIVRSHARQSGVHFARRCTSAVGVGSPENEGARPPQVRLFFRVSIASASFSMTAQVGEHSCSPVPSFRSSNPALGRHPRLEAGVAVFDRNEGADTMAGQSLGAPASPSGAQARRTLQLAPGKTRTRLSHGAFPLGELVASVYSSRRERDGRVTLVVGRDSVRLDVCMSPSQARAMAHVLDIAARAAEAAESGSKGGAA